MVYTHQRRIHPMNLWLMSLIARYQNSLTPDDEGITNMENIPQTNGITYNLGPDLESDEEEFMGQFHSIAPSNCPYCNNCHPQVVVEFFVNFCGEPFTRN